MLKGDRVKGASDRWALFRDVPGYAILASLWVFASHLFFDILLAHSPYHERYETIADAVMAVPTTLIVFLLLRREFLTRARLEKDRDARARRLQHILKNANDAIIGLDQDDQIFLFNRGAEAIFGYRREEMYGRPIQRLLPAESAELLREEILRSGSASETLSTETPGCARPKRAAGTARNSLSSSVCPVSRRTARSSSPLSSGTSHAAKWPKSLC